MRLTHVGIRNFRGIRELSLQLDDLCVLIGENNAGKSSILDAVRLCLTKPLTRRAAVFEEYDYHLKDASADPTTSEPIGITLTFEEPQESKWPADVSQQMRNVAQIDESGRKAVILRVTSGYKTKTGDYETDYDFLDRSGNALTQARNPATLMALQRLAPAFHLESLRDAARAFQARAPFWGPFVRALDIDDQAREDLEHALHQLNQEILGKHTAFDSVREHLRKLAELMPLGEGDPVSIETLPSKIFDILSRTQVHLSSRTGAHIPVRQHGSGTQSLAVVCLFNAFLRSRLAEGYGESATPILAMEEPEAHLHPAAVMSVGNLLAGTPGQKIVSTHSGELMAGVPLRSIRRIRRDASGVHAHAVAEGALSPEDADKLDYHVRTTRGSLFFSRCWLLVEGKTDAVLLQEFARIMGHRLYADGVSCIEFSQVGVEPFVKLANQLGIEWFVLADKDQAGERYIASAAKHLEGRPESEHTKILDHGAMEVFLCMEGFGNIFEEGVSGQKRDRIATPKSDAPDSWQQVVRAQGGKAKPANALRVAQCAAERGADSVPQLLKDVIAQVRNLAKGAN